MADLTNGVDSSFAYSPSMTDAAGNNLSLPWRSADVFGEILWLFAHSPMHRRWRLEELQSFVLPAMETNRFKLYRGNGRPIGYVGLALLSKAVEDRWLAGGYRLRSEDWISGDRPWVMDFVAPFGDAEAVRRQFQYEREIAGKVVRALRPNKRGESLRVVTYGPHLLRQLEHWASREKPAAIGGGPDEVWSRDAAEDGPAPAGLTGPLPHARDLLWATPPEWIYRCCTRYKYAPGDEPAAPRTTAQAGAPPGLEQRGNAMLLGEIALLMISIEQRRQWRLWDFARLVMPAIGRQQFRLYYRDRLPIAYASWAFLSADAETRFLADPMALRPEHWASGERAYIVDVVALPGALAGIGSLLRQDPLLETHRVRGIRTRNGALKLIEVAPRRRAAPWRAAISDLPNDQRKTAPLTS